MKREMETAARVMATATKRARTRAARAMATATKRAMIIYGEGNVDNSKSVGNGKK
jgi:hypothetical protein